MKQILTTLVFVLVLFSCKRKDEVEIPKNNVQLNWKHTFNSNDITEDSLAFLNVFGDTLSVSRVTYFLSDFKLIGEQTTYQSGNVVLLDLFGNKNLSFNLENVPSGHYHTLEMTFGLDSLVNVFGLIQNSIDHNEMFWPVSMGGGYHFMKFEGHYLDSGRIKGYAMHIGKNGNQIRYSMPIQLDIPNHKFIDFEVHLDEWLKNPYGYRFTKDGAFTMAYDDLMRLIVGNGKDVFEIKNLR